MTSRISLFNKGIYKSTVRRCIWGAALYAIILFLSTVFPILFSGTYMVSSPETINRYLLTREYLLLPLIYALVAPSVFTLLIFRFIHSKRQSIFTHSLPVSRNAIFVSSAAAAITLMAIPVILNGVILCVMSFCGFGMLFNVTGCLVWIAYNLLAQVIMLSAALFAASLTGNSFAFVGINVFVHFFVNMLLGAIATVSEVFLYGFYNSGGIIGAVEELVFPVAIINLVNNYDYVNEVFNPFPWARFAIICAIAAVLFALAFVLYKKRRIETAEDIAAYYILNPIFKYLLTFLSSLGAFVVYAHDFAGDILPCVLTILIVSAVVYFAVEMLLKKSFRVWKAYKGYLVYLVAFSAFIALFAFTGFFGFETRVPDVEDIESVAIADYVPRYSDANYVNTPEVIGYATELHELLTEKENIYKIKNSNPDRQLVICILYKLKNGREFAREYQVTADMQYDALGECFARAGYKEANVDILKKIDNIYAVELGYERINLSEEEEKELLECIREDVAELSYMEYAYRSWGMRIAFNGGSEEILSTAGEHYTREIQINSNYARTVRWLKVHDYEKMLWNPRNLDVCILTAAQYTEAISSEKVMLDAASAGVQPVEIAQYAPRSFDRIPGVRRFTGKEVDEIRELIITESGALRHSEDYAYYICTIDEAGYINNIAVLYGDSGIKKFL